ncbi:DUF1244 domain-containing protein [Nitratireductor pacificus]
MHEVRHFGSPPTGQDEDPIMTTLTDDQKRDLEAAAFRRLVEHLRGRSDVQNIDLMNLAGFCRNCLSNWYREAAEADGIALSKDESREIVYGMPYEEWRALHQTEATDDQKASFEANRPKDH